MRRAPNALKCAVFLAWSGGGTLSFWFGRAKSGRVEFLAGKGGGRSLKTFDTVRKDILINIITHSPTISILNEIDKTYLD